MGGLRLILQALLLSEASATTSAVTELFAFALICTVGFSFYSQPSFDAAVYGLPGVSTHREASPPLLGMNVAGLALTLISLATYFYWFNSRPAFFGRAPPPLHCLELELDEPPATAAPPPDADAAVDDEPSSALEMGRHRDRGAVKVM